MREFGCEIPYKPAIPTKDKSKHFICVACSHHFKFIELPKSGFFNCPKCGLAYHLDEHGKLKIRNW